MLKARKQRKSMSVALNSTGVPQNTRVPWDSAKGAANNCNSLFFSPIFLSRGAAKYWNILPRVPRGKKGWETLV